MFPLPGNCPPNQADFLFVSTSRVYPVAATWTWPSKRPIRVTPCGPEAVAGASEHGISEAFPLDGARSLYGMTKLAAELMVEEYGDAYGLRSIIDRCGLLTGPWQMAKSDQGVVAYWVAAHCLNRGLQYIGFGGTGKQVRDFLHVDDLCDLVLAQIGGSRDVPRRRWNVGGGVRNSLSLRKPRTYAGRLPAAPSK